MLTLLCSAADAFSSSGGVCKAKCKWSSLECVCVCVLEYLVYCLPCSSSQFKKGNLPKTMYGSFCFEHSLSADEANSPSSTYGWQVTWLKPGYPSGVNESKFQAYSSVLLERFGLLRCPFLPSVLGKSEGPVRGAALARHAANHLAERGEEAEQADQERVFQGMWLLPGGGFNVWSGFWPECSGFVVRKTSVKGSCWVSLLKSQ